MPVQLFGLVTPCRVRHVYAADRFSIQLIDQYGHETSDDITLQLHVRANTLMRPGDPPLAALKLFDPEAADGHTSDAPGPCPDARRFTNRLIRKSKNVVAHVPIPARRDWLASLCPGTIELGHLYLLPRDRDASTAAYGDWVNVADELLAAGHATIREPDECKPPRRKSKPA